MRNSSLVKEDCTEDVTGLKLGTEDTYSYFVGVVEERLLSIEAQM